MTEGKLRMQTSIVHLPKLEVPLTFGEQPRRLARLGDQAWPRIWAAVDDRTKAATDWWWVIYPSHVPETGPDFATMEFITGGMGRGPDGLSPCFIVDDRWLLRKPPHLGQGDYTSIERRAYLPQWLQHEFFHHLFGTWPDLGLEADYLHEALYRRLRSRATPEMHVALRYRPPDPSLLSKLDVADLAGEYVREPRENGWHVGQIMLKGRGKRAKLSWKNEGGVGWKLEPDLAAGRLRTGPDNPYFDVGSPIDQDFHSVLGRDEQGEWIPRIDGFRYRGELYRRRR